MMHVQESQMHLYNIMLSQYSMNKDIVISSTEGVDDIISELELLHDTKTLEPIASEILTREENRKLCAT